MEADIHPGMSSRACTLIQRARKWLHGSREFTEKWPGYFAWRWTVGASIGVVMAPIRAMNQIGQFKWTPKKSAETVTDPETAGGSEKRLDRPRLTPTGQRLDSFGLKVD